MKIPAWKYLFQSKLFGLNYPFIKGNTELVTWQFQHIFINYSFITKQIVPVNWASHSPNLLEAINLTDNLMLSNSFLCQHFGVSHWPGLLKSLLIIGDWRSQIQGDCRTRRLKLNLDVRMSVRPNFSTLKILKCFLVLLCSLTLYFLSSQLSSYNVCSL